MKKRPSCIFMGYPLVNFCADKFTIYRDTDCDRRTDRQTQGDNNSSADLRPAELKKHASNFDYKLSK